jgi:hypothetical protein
MSGCLVLDQGEVFPGTSVGAPGDARDAEGGRSLQEPHAAA